MKLRSRRAAAGLLFDKKNIPNRFFRRRGLKIYQHYKMERNIIIVIPYIKTKTIKVPDKKERMVLRNRHCNRSKVEVLDFAKVFSRLR